MFVIRSAEQMAHAIEIREASGPSCRFDSFVTRQG